MAVPASQLCDKVAQSGANLWWDDSNHGVLRVTEAMERGIVSD
jgi:hypothetical protein